MPENSAEIFVQVWRLFLLLSRLFAHPSNTTPFFFDGGDGDKMLIDGDSSDMLVHEQLGGVQRTCHRCQSRVPLSPVFIGCVDSMWQSLIWNLNDWRRLTYECWSVDLSKFIDWTIAVSVSKFSRRNKWKPVIINHTDSCVLLMYA